MKIHFISLFIGLDISLHSRVKLKAALVSMITYSDIQQTLSAHKNELEALGSAKTFSFRFYGKTTK